MNEEEAQILTLKKSKFSLSIESKRITFHSLNNFAWLLLDIYLCLDMYEFR